MAGYWYAIEQPSGCAPGAYRVKLHRFRSPEARDARVVSDRRRFSLAPLGWLAREIERADRLGVWIDSGPDESWILVVLDVRARQRGSQPAPAIVS